MSDIYQQSNDGESLSLDRETLGGLLVRHPWTVRFAAVELVLLSLVGVIPFFGEGAFYYVLFGIVASLAGLGAIVFVAVGLVVAVRRGAARLRRSAPDLAR
jgi:hypothetical protein